MLFETAVKLMNATYGLGVPSPATESLSKRATAALAAPITHPEIDLGTQDDFRQVADPTTRNETFRKLEQGMDELFGALTVETAGRPARGIDQSVEKLRDGLGLNDLAELRKSAPRSALPSTQAQRDRLDEILDEFSSKIRARTRAIQRAE